MMWRCWLVRVHVLARLQAASHSAWDPFIPAHACGEQASVLACP